MTWGAAPPRHRCTRYAQIEYGPDYVRCACGYTWRLTAIGWLPIRYGRAAS